MMLQVSIDWDGNEKEDGGKGKRKKRSRLIYPCSSRSVLSRLRPPTRSRHASEKRRVSVFSRLRRVSAISSKRPDSTFWRTVAPARLNAEIFSPGNRLGFCPQACPSRRSRLLSEKSPPSFANSTDVNSNYLHCGRLNLWRPSEVTAIVIAGCYCDILDWKSNSLKFKMLAFWNDLYYHY